jgi:hypothetical protein
MREKTKLRKVRIITAGIITITILIFAGYYIHRFSYSKNLPFYPMTTGRDTSLTIGIIGDSWVDEKRLDTVLHDLLLANGINSRIISAAHPGARSNLIYEDLYKDSNLKYSSKFIIENHPEYCVVVTGVNDAATQIGGHFYAYYVKQIARTLLHYGIKPLIVSMPEFGIEKATGRLSLFSRTKYILSSYMNNHGNIDNIKTYRKDLVEELESAHLKDSITMIDFDEVCVDFEKNPEYYENPSHLSNLGNEKLCQIINNDIVKVIRAHRHIQISNSQIKGILKP